MRSTPRLGAFAVILLALCLGCFGCAGFQHGYALPEHANRMLSVGGADGTRRLELETRFDPTIRGFVRDHGDPDYIFVESSKRVHLLYVQRGFAAEFSRRGFTAISGVEVQDGIPPHFARQIARLPGAVAPAKDADAVEGTPDAADESD